MSLANCSAQGSWKIETFCDSLSWGTEPYGTSCPTSIPSCGHSVALGPEGKAQAGLEFKLGKMPGWAAILWALRVNYATKGHETGTTHKAVKQKKGTACSPLPAGLMDSGPRSRFKKIGLYGVPFSQNAPGENLVTQGCAWHTCIYHTHDFICPTLFLWD